MSKSKRKKNTKEDDLVFLRNIVDNKKIGIHEIDEFSQISYPLFSFKWFNIKNAEKCSDPKYFISYLSRLHKLSQLGWEGIRTSPRHCYGMEKIPVKKIKIKNLPDIVTPDVQYLDVLRAVEDNRPMVGLQQGKIFHVFFLETYFGDVYDHGCK